jgi:hypothetical protein
LDQPPGDAEGEPAEPDCEGLDELDHPEEELEEGGGGELGLVELDQPDEELERLPPNEKDEPEPLLLAKTGPTGPNTRITATARARIERKNMWGLLNRSSGPGRS